ncbi:thiol peroxidase [Deferribacterales bacterium Es71-Z0220]|jgi:thiol peroxidase|uniref:thiol peroxidase n=1 Tax=Deferrivibrio essentukiensis TaxID=2880922 RepID=UPI001F61B633|nr:thiol peroxidase [Deferrivibrio essentukiensis]MBZ4643896.1 peroxiredoxin [Deferribacteraceae bacterium]MCB4204697.1 thiol peroxidase [Deferrivibrio essentukiensis]MDK2791354.1 thioredoxin-dependent peroxiredoxin [Deferribacteres bacterium]
MERKGLITMKGNPVTLFGNEVKVGDNAPDFNVVDMGLAPKSLQDYSGKLKIISVTPSLDTPVCDMQMRTFNEKASKYKDAVVLNISMDLPFAIKRFCTTAGIENVVGLSDYKDASFGQNYGLLIKELRLLARAVLVIDKDDKIVYYELVKEVTEHPDYEKLFAFLDNL